MYKLMQLLKEVLPDWDNRIMTASKHGVLPLLYEVCEENTECPEHIKEQIRQKTLQTVKQSYRLLFLSRYICTKLNKEGISAVLLKGVATASYYPIPEYRKSGDVDILLLEKDKISSCCDVLYNLGFIKEMDRSEIHHIAFYSPEGIEIEIHTMLAEPFDNQKINRYLVELVPKCAQHIEYKDVMGVELPVLKTGFHAFQLLLHMLQHFLRAGFGLKLLCDWVMFWNSIHEKDECELYILLVNESGLKGFSDMITQVCCDYLGLSEDKVSWMNIERKYDTDEFMNEVLEAEEFGRSTHERMVALRGNGLWDYVIEFHHQMHLRYEKAGKWFLLWPALWIMTLYHFLRNNRKVRNVSACAILKKAGQRGRLIKQMKLWENNK